MNDKFQSSLHKFLKSLVGLEFNSKMVFDVDGMNGCCHLERGDVQIYCTPFWDGFNGILVEVRVDDEQVYAHEIEYPKIETDAQYIVFCKWYLEQLAIISDNYFEQKIVIYVHK